MVKVPVPGNTILTTLCQWDRVILQFIGPDEVLIKLNATGICYSDIHYMLNDTGGRKMSASGIWSAGHEGSGVVVKLGENVTTFQVGDRAGVKPIWNTCGSCSLCWGGKEVHCQKKILTGVGATGKTAFKIFRQYSLSYCEC
jgi:D-arabinose 1-dehydrogenase-like Zn-dependent alcohol dehydrogenase